MRKIRFSLKIELSIVVLTSALLSLSFIIPSVAFLTWFGFIPWLLKAETRSLKWSFWSAFLVGLLFFTATTYWITYTITKYGELPFIVSAFLNLLLAGYLALFFGLFGLSFALIQKKIGLTCALMLAPSAWIIIEFIRGFFLTGFPWNLLAYSQYRYLPVIQLCEFTGPYGLSWLILSVNTVVVLLLMKLMYKKFNLPVLYIVVIFLVFLLNLIYGIVKTGDYPKTEGLNVSLVQGNTELGRPWTIRDCIKNLEKHLKMIEIGTESNCELTVLSESAIRCYGYYSGSMLHNAFYSAALSGSTDILFGSATMQMTESGSRYYNSAVLIHKSGKEPEIYSKVHLVPFGEYIPFRKILFFVEKFSKGAIGDFSAGAGPILLSTSKGVHFGVGICYELLFPELMRKFTDNGAEFLVNITNDTWYGKTVMPYHHFSLSVFRAVENRKFVVRAANSGLTGIVAPDGSILKISKLFIEEIISGTVYPNKIRTFYVKCGDWFVFLNLVIISIICLTAIYKNRKA